MTVKQGSSGVCAGEMTMGKAPAADREPVGSDASVERSAPVPARGRLVFLNEVAVDARDYRRYGMAWLADRGYHVTVYDLSDLVMPAAPKDRSGYPGFDKAEIRVVRSLDDLRDATPELVRAGLIINNCTFRPSTCPIYQVLSKIQTPTMFLWDRPVPRESLASSCRNGLAGAAGYLCWRIRQGRVVDALRHRLQARLAAGTGVRPPEYLVFGGRRSADDVTLMSEASRSIWAHAMDYDVYLEERAKGHTVRDIAVFIDEFLPFHRDLAAFGRVAPMQAERYYTLLRRFFDRLEGELGLRVVIAACPRADYRDKPGLFGDREVAYFKTAELVASSRLVVAHRSTAINYAVLFRKPLLLIATRELTRSHHRPYLNGWAHALSRPLLSLDAPERARFTQLLDVDERVYAAFQEDYIKTSASPQVPYWEIVMSEFERCR